MKHILLLAAAATACAMTMNAQDEVNNLVLNGNFESPNYVQAVPGGYTWDPWNKQLKLESCEGWIVTNTGGEWNGGLEIKAGDDYVGDGDVRPDDDMQYMHFWGYNDNGWTNINCAAVVNNLVVGRQYNLDFVIAVNWPEGAASTPDPNYGVTVSELDKDAEGNPQAGRQIMEEKLMADGQDMIPVAYKFTATSTSIYLNFFLSNYYGKENKHDNLWMDLDLVRVWSVEGDEPSVGGVNFATVDNNAPREIYNLQGIRVNDSNLKGVYIVKQGSKVCKVVF